MAAEEKIRIDKWLWAARFFKTRSLAGRAVNGGHVQVNGHRVKAAKIVQIGDAVHVRRGMVIFDVVIRELSSRRGPAAVAQTLYRETEESVDRREQAALDRRFMHPAGITPSRRPDKRDRRKIRKLLQKD